MRIALIAALVAAAAGAADTVPAQVVGKLDELQLQRDQPEAQKALDQLVSDSLKQFPDSYEVTWRAARFECWVAETASTDARKKVAAKLAWDYGDKAMKLKPEAPEGNYYAAAGVGLYGEAMGIMTAISAGVQGKFNERLDKAIKIDPTVERGGPWLARGRYYYEVPWFMRDLKKSAEFLGKAVAKHPENLRAHWYLAQTLLKDGDAKKAKAEIELVLNGSETYDPPDARLVKGNAHKTRAEIDEALKP